MKIEADFTTEIHYFNDLFGTWEPLVEPNVNAASYQPYELNARVSYMSFCYMERYCLCKLEFDARNADNAQFFFCKFMQFEVKVVSS